MKINFNILMFCTIFSLYSMEKSSDCEYCLPKNECSLAKTDNFQAYLEAPDVENIHIFLTSKDHLLKSSKFTSMQWQEFGFFFEALEKAYKAVFTSDCDGSIINRKHFFCQLSAVKQVENFVCSNKEIHDFICKEDSDSDDCCGHHTVKSITTAIQLKIIKELQNKLDVSHLPGGQIVNKE